MKIWRAEEFGDPRLVLKQVEVEAPKTPKGCIAVRVAACGVGLPDLMMIQGQYPLVQRTPLTPGQEVAGTIIEVGEGAPFEVGQRVMTTTQFFKGWGGFAEVCLSKNWDMTSPIPDGMTDEQAAGFLIPFHTAHGGLVQRVDLQKGETLLVLGGAGSSGSAAIQLGKVLGATVIAAAGSPEKMSFCLDQGADHAINYRSETVSERVLELTGGKGADVTFDPVGGEAYLDATKCVAHDGRIALVGFASGSWPGVTSADLLAEATPS